MQAQQALPPLTHIVVQTSSVVPASLEEVWGAVRGFSSIAQWSAPIGLERISAELLPGSVDGQVGALRHVRLGALGFVEQLEALDDDRRLLKWRVVSHPLNANPFPGSLLNYKAKLRLYDVTVARQTFMQLECSFETEHQNGEIMRRELRTRQEANIRGVLALMQAQSSFRAEQLSAPLQPHLVPMPPLGAATVLPGMLPGAALPGQYIAASASRELSPSSQAIRASISTGPSEDYLMAPMASLQSSLAASSLNSAGWGSSLESASVVRVPGGMSATYEAPLQQQQQQAALQPPALQHTQVPLPAASVHDSAATVQSMDFSKVLQNAQAQAQVQGMGSQLARLNARLQQQQQQQGLSLADSTRPAFKSSAAMTAAMAGSSQVHQMRARASDDMLVAQKGARSDPDSLSAESRVLSL